MYGWGISMVDKVQKEGNLFVPIESDKILDAPEYKERMFIKTKKNRKMIIKACQEGKFPNIKNTLNLPATRAGRKPQHLYKIFIIFQKFPSITF